MYPIYSRHFQSWFPQAKLRATLLVLL